MHNGHFMFLADCQASNASQSSFAQLRWKYVKGVAMELRWKSSLISAWECRFRFVFRGAHRADATSFIAKVSFAYSLARWFLRRENRWTIDDLLSQRTGKKYSFPWVRLIFHANVIEMWGFYRYFYSSYYLLQIHLLNHNQWWWKGVP